MNQANDIPPGDDGGRQADERLIHALLLHVHDEQAADHREQRVQRAMQAIRAPATWQAPVAAAPGPASRRTLQIPTWARRSVWAVAAMVLLAVGIWELVPKPAPAMASLNDILTALDRPGDRMYRIQMEDLPAPPERRTGEDRPPNFAPRPNLNDATLYLRDGRQYLLVRNDPKGGELMDGFDGRQSWRVKDGTVAEVKEGLGAGGIPMPPIMAGVPFSDLQQTLSRIRVDYTAERLDQAPLPSGGAMLRYVRVRRNSHEVRGPETIEIWADLKTAMPKRIVFDRAKLQGNRQPCRLTFELVSEETLAGDWFSPGPHVRAGSPRS